MRYSEQELYRMACSAAGASKATVQGRLHYKGIQQGKLRPVRELQAFREREFRLQGNFLFYYKLAEDRRQPEPLGALLLERCTVQREMNTEKGFVFSIAFQEDRERKHFFLAPSAQLCDQWVLAIRNASYEQLKATWIMLHGKVKRLTDMPVARQQQPTETQQKQHRPLVPTSTVTARPPPARPPRQAPTLKPQRNAPPPPSTPQEPAEGLLIDFS